MNDTEPRVRILIVEDERIIAIDMRHRLERLGYEVVGLVDNADDALAYAVAENPDLILMDIRLKGERDGLEAAETIRQARDIPVVYTTSYTDDDTLTRAKSSQAMGYIVKPYKDREVLIAIEMALFRHRMETELRSSRELLNSTLQAIGDGVIALDKADRVVFMNRAAELLLGRSAAQVAGLPFDQLCTLRENPDLQSFSATADDGGARDSTCLVLDTDQASRPVQCTSRSLHATEDGRVVVLRDLSELLSADYNRSRLAAIVSNSADAIYAVDLSMTVKSWNRGAQLMYGYTAEEMIGRDLGLLFPGEPEYREFRSLLDRVAAGQPLQSLESPRRCRIGTTLTVSVSVSALRSRLDGALEFACIERDVTGDKEREAALLAAKILAEDANRAKSEFLANMSHELRTPLNGIMGMVEISRGLAASAEQEEYLGIAQHSAEELVFLINSLLDFSKLEVGKMRLEPQPFKPADCVQACVRRMGPEAEAKGLEFRLQLDPSLPAAVLGDEHRIGQIMIHLLSNAIKFTPAGTVRLLLDALPGDRPGLVGLRIRVVDTGIGIPADRCGVIWDKFTQVDASSTRSYGGTGLGLALVKALTELMGGTVQVTSTLNKGSEFTVLLPLAIPDETRGTKN